MRRPTIEDVARLAEVSVGTASNVLSGKDVVSAKRREQVLRAAEQIGYRPNGLARGLRQRRANVVGLSIPGVSSSFHTSLAEAIEGVAASNRQTLMQVMTHGDPDLEYDRIDALVQRRVDGLIMMPSRAPQRSLELLRKSHLPAVVLGRDPVPDGGFDRITLDERAAMAAAVAHLTDLGHRRILFLVRFPQLSVTRERIAALEALSRSSAGDLVSNVIAFGDDRDLFERRLPELMGGPDAPTAIIASNSILALWLAQALLRLEMSWPLDVSIVCFDDPVWGDIVKPQLTIVRQPVEALAASAWALLSDRVFGAWTGEAREVVFNAELVTRGSTAPPRGG
ncbi:LacI family DNA-binding transcriptional regulator [Rubrimonas sp.]|uniref:LacI family DNA-binding transcriptional regulator n=1 Tax=Rubrimonas sp. TaxID=2036015 RepID=UPI002FDE44A2